MRNVLVVLSGPSGVGKGTIAKLLVERNKSLALSISCTTRSPRDGEVNGKEYFFIPKPEFEEKIKNNGFLEYSEHFENFYGTPKKETEAKKTAAKSTEKKTKTAAKPTKNLLIIESPNKIKSTSDFSHK